MKQLFLLAISLFLLCQVPVRAQDLDERESERASLFEAIQAGDKEAVLKILSNPHHADLNQRDPEEGGTFLMAAIRSDEPEIVQILLQRGADPNLRELSGADEDGHPLGEAPLDAAIEQESTAIVRLLVQYGVNLQRYPAALHSATSIEMARLLLDHGALVDGRDESGETYLQTVVNDEELEDIARLLIERGANVNITDSDGTPLVMQIESVEMARLMIERGANVNAVDKEGSTILHQVASQPERIDFAKFLIAHGADVNARDMDGKTPLDLIVTEAFDYDFALLLVAHGARINKKLVRENQLVEEFARIKRAVAAKPRRSE